MLDLSSYAATASTNANMPMQANECYSTNIPLQSIVATTTNECDHDDDIYYTEIEEPLTGPQAAEGEYEYIPESHTAATQAEISLEVNECYSFNKTPQELTDTTVANNVVASEEADLQTIEEEYDDILDSHTAVKANGTMEADILLQVNESYSFTTPQETSTTTAGECIASISLEEDNDIYTEIEESLTELQDIKEDYDNIPGHL